MALLDYMEAKTLLGRYGINSIESKYMGSAADAVKFSKGEPIVMKVLSDKALHKSKAGLVKLNLSDKKEITTAYNELSRKAKALSPYKIIAQKMVKGGIEIIIGGKTDQQFGKFVLIGLGGIYVEAFKDFALRLCPISRYDAEEMISQLRSKNVITYNGKTTKMLADLLLKTSKLLVGHQEINELDLNPVIISESGYQTVDIRVLE
jgi:succinyl-CoA synthetase beta subunit